MIQALGIILALGAAGKSAQPAADLQWEFAQGLYVEKDFDHAALEFERFSALYPEDSRGEEAEGQALEALIQAQAWKKAVSRLETFRSKHPNNPKADLLSVRLLRSRSLGEEGEGSGLSPDKVLPLLRDPQARQDCRMIQILDRIQDEDGADANRAMKEFLEEFPQSPRALKVRKALALNDPLPRFPKRGGGLAALFSLVVPGSGQVYVGHPDRGLALAAGCGVLGLAAYESWNEDMKAQALIWSGFALAAYVAQAGGAARAAGDLEVKDRDKHREEMIRVLDEGKAEQ